MFVFRKIKSLFNPPEFQGWGMKSRYFEGWYFKIVDPSEKYAFAVIPGVAMDGNGNKQAFIQVLDGKLQSAAYHKFGFDEFKALPGTFEITIRDNYFSEKEMRIDLPGLKGELLFSRNVPWPGKWYSPGIMGPYTFAPFMECYHGVVSMDHVITGSLLVGGREVDFSGGRGYMEKDWGRSFPGAYIWMQSNHFSEPGISLKASVARIPWVTGSFTGFIAGLWLNGELFRFTTYNGTKLLRSKANGSSVAITMENRRYRLELEADRDRATGLASPIRGFMDGRIEESMTSVVRVKLMDARSGQLLLDDIGRNAGLEVAGKIEKIMV